MATKSARIKRPISRKKPIRSRSGAKRGRPVDPTLPERRRDQILSAATKLFAKNGFTATDTDALAKKIGIGKGTIYRYFPSKSSLFRAALTRQLESMWAEVNTGLSDSTNDLEFVRSVVERTLRAFSNRPDLVELMIIERANLPRSTKPAYFAFRERNLPKWSAKISKAQRAGRIRPMDLEILMAGMGSIVYGAALAHSYMLTDRTLASVAADLSDLLYHGYAKQ